MSYGPAGMETFDDYDYIVYNYESDEDGFFFGDSQPRGNNNAFNSHQNTNIASCTSVNGDFSSAGVKTNSVTNQNQSFGKQESVGFGTGRGRGMIAAQCAQTVGQNEKRTGGFPSAPSSSSSKGKKRNSFSSPGSKGPSAWRGARDVATVNLEDFRVAVMNGNVSAVKKFLDKGVNPDAVLKSGWTALLHAADAGNLEVMDMLLKKGANVNFQKDMYTVLMAACSATVNSEEQLLQCVDLLLKYGVRVNVFDKYRMSPLMYAAREGRILLCERLLEHDAEINRQDSMGWTALSMAAQRGHGRLVRILLDHKANPKLYTNDGQAPSDIAYSHGFTTLAEILEGIVSGKPTRAVNAGASSSAESPAVVSYGDMELFLLGLELGHLIPKFQEHQITFEGLTQVAEKDLIQMGISQVGVRKKLLDGIRDLHKKEWDMTSVTQQLEILSAADTTAILANIAKYLSVLQSSVVYVQGRLSQVQDTTQFVQDVAETEGMVVYAREASQTVDKLNRHLASLQDQVHRLASTATQTSADLIQDSSAEATSSSRSARGVIIFVGAAALMGLFLAKRNWQT